MPPYKKEKIIVLLVLLLVVTACQTAPTASPSPTPASPSPTATPPSPTATPQPVVAAQPEVQVSPLFRGDPQRLGLYAATGDFGEWAFKAGGPLTSSPVVEGDRVYFGTMLGTFYALDLNTRQPAWQAQLPVAVFASAAVTDEAVYVATLSGSVHALSKADGKEIWKFQTGKPIISSPAVSNDQIFFGGLDGAIYAVNAQTGKQTWKRQTQKAINSSPVVADGMVVVGGEDGFVYALDANTGEVRWMHLVGSPVIASPTVFEDRVLIGCENEEGASAHAIDLKTGKTIWKLPADLILSTMAVADGVAYGASGNGKIMAASASDGSPIWDFNAGTMVIASPAVAPDQVIIGDNQGVLHALDRQTGDEQWTFSTYGSIWSSAAIAGETVIVGSADGYLYALNRHDPQLTPPEVAASLPVEPTPSMLPEPPAPTIAGADGLPWWNERVFYEVFVRSFKDSNGDGTGDLKGLIEKLDYLNDGDPNTTSDLGVTGLWLMPLAESPSYHGYDVTDYRTIEQDYGANADFKKLVEEAHKRGIAVIVDMVLNHTSNQHPWFRQAAFPGSPTENWYIWSPTQLDYQSPWGSDVCHQPPGFNLEELRAYHTLDDYYYGLFWSGMPDLNYRNGAVTKEMFDVLKFWLSDFSVDGFRLDAVRHLIEDGAVQENTPETHAWLQNFDHYVHTINPNALTVGEIWDDTADVAPYVPDEVDIAFEFKLAEAIIEAVNTGDNGGLVKQMQEVLDTYPEGQFAPFLTNHDMTRAMTQLGEDLEKAKLAAALLLTAPGTPFLYYGEEIGLTGVRPEDTEVRRPMPWDESPAAGFTSGEPWYPVGKNPPGANVEAQNADPNSLLSRYRDLIHLRNEHSALSAGDAWVVQSSAPQVYSLLRADESEKYLVVANLTGEAVKGYQLSLASGPLQGKVKPEMVFGDGKPGAMRINKNGGFESYTPLGEIPAYGVLIIKL